MPRKGHTQKRDVLADPLYGNKVVTKLINNIMLDKSKTYRWCYLSGSDRGKSRQTSGTGSSLVNNVLS